MTRSLDPAVNDLLQVAEKENICTIWDRHTEQEPQCGFGLLGVCCRICMQGPCRIDPFASGGPSSGICGASADTIAIRNYARMVAGGAAAHSGHAKHLVHALRKVAEGDAPDYGVKDEAKLRRVATRLGLCEENGAGQAELLEGVIETALADFGERRGPPDFATSTLAAPRQELLARQGVMPMGIDATIAETLHRTTYGVDAQPTNIFLGAVKCALADFTGMHMATDIADIMFGTPRPVVSRSNLGVLREDAVNIAVHGHNPILSDVVATTARSLDAEARAAGAPGGVNLVGICCTGAEVLMRHGIPTATHSISQELAIMTGALELLAVDCQCIMPSLATVAECFHTELVTTMAICKLPGARHIDMTEENAKEAAARIIRLGIESFRRRDPARVNIPKHVFEAIAGFSTESIVDTLSVLDQREPLRPLRDAIVKGDIRGICLLAGCNNVRVTHDSGFLEIGRRLSKANVLIVATGCGAGAFGRHGLLSSEAAESTAGAGLLGVLRALGNAAGLDGPLPPVLHMGSCVDNSRAADLAVTIANYLGVDVDALPLVASAPEPTTEKAVSIATWAVATGIPTHLGVAPSVMGAPAAAEILTETSKELFGACFIVEPDPSKAASKLLATIDARRVALGLCTQGT